MEGRKEKERGRVEEGNIFCIGYNDHDHPRNRANCSLTHFGQFLKISSKSAHGLLSRVANRQTNPAKNKIIFAKGTNLKCFLDLYSLVEGFLLLASQFSFHFHWLPFTAIACTERRSNFKRWKPATGRTVKKKTNCLCMCSQSLMIIPMIGFGKKGVPIRVNRCSQF